MDDQNGQENKPTVYTEDPFSYNYVSLKQTKVDELPLPSTTEVIANPVSHAIGKAFGIENPHDWNKYYQKVFTITEWAKERSGLTEPAEILKWIEDKVKSIPNFGSRKINDLYLHIRMGIKKGKDVKNTLRG